MKNQNTEELEKIISRKAERRAKKKKPVMRVSGAGVKKLQALIIKN